MGIFFGDTGVEFRTGDIAGLASKVERYERLLVQIERDLSWTAHLSEVKIPQSGTSNLRLVISFARKLQMQPILQGKVQISAVPHFRNDAFKELKLTDRLGFIRSEWTKDRSAQFDEIKKDLDGTIQDYYNERSIRLTVHQFDGFDLKALVHSISDTGYILPPRTLATCFAMRVSNAGLPLEAPISTNGANCGEDFSYVDNILRR
jgi:hypothetical protein